MPENHRRAKLMYVEDELLANPQHVLDRLLLELTGGLDTRVDEEVGRTMVAGREPVQEFQVMRREKLERVLERVLGDAVAVESLGATVKEKRFAIVAREAEERQHHVLMIALKEDDLG